MTVHDVDVQPVGLGIDLFDGAAELAKIGRKDGRGDANLAGRARVYLRHDEQPRPAHLALRPLSARSRPLRRPRHHARALIVDEPAGRTASSSQRVRRCDPTTTTSLTRTPPNPRGRDLRSSRADTTTMRLTFDEEVGTTRDERCAAPISADHRRAEVAASPS